MTYTELFRDFLCMHGIKKLFEEYYRKNTDPNAFKRKYKLSFKDDFMTKVLLKKAKHSKPFNFLSLTYFITWDEISLFDKYGDKFDFWCEKNKEWLKFVEQAEENGLIDKR